MFKAGCLGAEQLVVLAGVRLSQSRMSSQNGERGNGRNQIEGGRRVYTNTMLLRSGMVRDLGIYAWDFALG
jgi:hypothetical protein